MTSGFTLNFKPHCKRKDKIMRTKQDYINGLSKMKRNIYFDGQLIDRDDELQMD